MVSKSDRKLTQDERSALSDQRLMDAAIALIISKGTAGTTLKALGQISGYSRGLVTYRFGTKAGLFKAVIKQVSDRWIQILQSRVGDHTGANALYECSNAYFEFVQKSPDDIRAMNILHQQACEPGSELQDIVKKVKQLQTWQLRSWVEQGQADGSINANLDADACAARFVAFNTGMTFLWMLDKNSINWPRMHQHAQDLLKKELAAD